MKPSWFLLAFGCLCLVSTPGCTPADNQPPAMPKVASGELIRIDSFQSEKIGNRRVDIWLPEGFPADSPYHVLYMHDGQMLFDSGSTWNHQEWGVDEVLSGLIREKKVPPTIVVGPWNAGTGRHPEFFPNGVFQLLPVEHQHYLMEEAKRGGATDLFTTSIRSDEYLRFLTKELKPFIDSVYPTLPGPEGTVVAGSSMGGLISMYALCEYPEVFGGAGCLSTHWIGTFNEENNPVPDAMLAYLAAHLPDSAQQRWYFDHGTKGLDAMYGRTQQRVDSLFRAKNWPASLFFSQVVEGADHREEDWNRRLHQPLEFLLRF